MNNLSDTQQLLENPHILPLAAWSLGLGIASLLLFGAIAGIPAIICGHMARTRIRMQPAKYCGWGMATAGLITGYLSIALSIGLGLLILLTISPVTSPFVYTLF